VKTELKKSCDTLINTSNVDQSTPQKRDLIVH